MTPTGKWSAFSRSRKLRWDGVLLDTCNRTRYRFQNAILRFVSSVPCSTLDGSPSDCSTSHRDDEYDSRQKKNGFFELHVASVSIKNELHREVMMSKDIDTRCCRDRMNCMKDEDELRGTT